MRVHARPSILSLTSCFVPTLAGAMLVLGGCRDNSKTGAPPPGAQSRHGAERHESHEDHDDKVTLSAEAITRYGIKVEKAAIHNLQSSFVSPARVTFNAETLAHVGTPLPGRAIAVHAKLGDQFKKGDTLLEIESPELGEAQSDFLVKQIAAEAAGPAADIARSAMDRAKSLYDESRGITLNELNRREGEYKTAQAALLSARAAANAAENKLHLLGMTQADVDKLRSSGEVNPRLNIVAPIAGQVVQRDVTLNELVSREKETLIVLADIDMLWVLADVPEARLGEVVVGAPAWIEAGNLDTHNHEAQVAYIAPQIDPRTRTASVRVVVHCKDGSLRPGMFVAVRIQTANRNSTQPASMVAIPEGAVQTIEGSTSVFVPIASESNTFAVRRVSVGRASGGMVPVISGLEAGEMFVASGSFLLKAELGKSEAGHQH